MQTSEQSMSQRDKFYKTCMYVLITIEDTVLHMGDGGMEEVKTGGREEGG